jgi:hypothetical protein
VERNFPNQTVVSRQRPRHDAAATGCDESARTEPCWKLHVPRDSSPAAASDLQIPIGLPIAEQLLSRDSISVSQRLQLQHGTGTAVFDHPMPARFSDSHFPHTVPAVVDLADHEAAPFQTTCCAGPTGPTTDRRGLVEPDRRTIGDEHSRLASDTGNGNQHATGQLVQAESHRNLVGSGHEQGSCSRNGKSGTKESVVDTATVPRDVTSCPATGRNRGLKSQRHWWPRVASLADASPLANLHTAPRHGPTWATVVSVGLPPGGDVRGTSFYFHPYHAHTGVWGSKCSARGYGGEREKEEDICVFFLYFSAKLLSPFVHLPSPTFTRRSATCFTPHRFFPQSVTLI